METQSILLLVQGGAGDVIASTPMIRGFRNAYPDDEIVVIATHAHLLENNPNIDKLISFSLSRELQDIYNLYTYAKKKIRFFKHYFLYDAFVDTPRFESTTLPEYVCNVYGAPYDGKPLDYTITPYEKDAAKEFMKQFSKPVVLLHLTGILPMKSVDFSIINPIITKYMGVYDFVQIGGATEARIENTHNALGMPMRDTISFMPLAKTSILIESVFAHCSNALGLKSVVVFQSTDPKFFGYNNHYNVWNSGGCEDWPCNRPIGSLNKFLPAYLNLSSGTPLPWMCPDPLCSKLGVKELEEVFKEAVEVQESENGPFKTLEEARNA